MTVAAQNHEIAHTRPSKLPRLGRRGGGWVALQMVLFVFMAVAGVAGPGWPAPARFLLSMAAVLVAVGGLLLFVGAARNLGREITPFPKPVEGGSLRLGGAYGLVRHPMYGGVLLLLLAWSLASSPLALVPWAVAAAFLDAKRRREEAWLVEVHSDYEDYRSRVRASFVPFVWRSMVSDHRALHPGQ